MGFRDTSRTILVVDDEPQLTEIARDEFMQAGWQVHVAHHVDGAKDILTKHACHAVLSDYGMEGQNGVDLLQWVRASKGDRLVFFLLTGSYDLRTRDIMKFGANAIFQKPCDWPRLINAVTVAVTLQLGRK